MYYKQLCTNNFIAKLQYILFMYFQCQLSWDFYVTPQRVCVCVCLVMYVEFHTFVIDVFIFVLMKTQILWYITLLKGT